MCERASDSATTRDGGSNEKAKTQMHNFVKRLYLLMALLEEIGLFGRIIAIRTGETVGIVVI